MCVCVYICVCACVREIGPCQPKKQKMNVSKYFRTEVKEMWTENFVICFIQIPA